MSTNSRTAALAKKFRAGTITADELAELDALEAAEDAARSRDPKAPAPRTIYDLPIAARMWKDDATTVEK